VNIYVRSGLVLLVLIVAVLFFGPMLVDWNRYRPELEDWLTRQSGHKVAIAGDLTVRILPQPRLALAKVTVGEGRDSAAPALLTLSGLDLKLGILPLLTGRIVVTELKLDGPQLALERRADGSFNLGQWEVPGVPRRVFAGFSPIPQDIAIDRIEITQGVLAYHDAIRDWRENVGEIGATAIALGRDGPYRARTEFAWAGRHWTAAVEAGAPAQAGNRPFTALIEIPDAGLKATLSGRLLLPAQADGKPAPWQLSGALGMQVARTDILLGKPAAAGAVVPILMFDGALAAGPAATSLKDWSLRWGDFGLAGNVEASYAADPTLSFKALGSNLNLDAVLPELAAASRTPYWPIAIVGLIPEAAPAGPAPARGLFSIFKGDLDVKLDALVFAQGRIASPTLTATFAGGALEIKDLGAILPGDSEFHVSGTLSGEAGFKGKAALAGERARELFTWWAIPLAGIEEGRLLRVAYLGGLEIGAGALKLSDFEAGLDGSQVKGQLALSRTAAGPPRITADLAVTRLNFDPYLPLLGADAKPVDTVLKLLDECEGDVKLAADVVIAQGAEARGLVTDFGLSRENGITLRSLKIDDWLGAGLTLAGSAKAVSGAAKLDLTGTAIGLDLRPLFVATGFALPWGEAPLGPATFDVKVALAEGTGEVTADGYLVGAKAGARLQLDKAEAPLEGRLGAGSLTLDAAVHGQNLAVLGRLFGDDPALSAQNAAADDNAHVYLAPIPEANVSIPAGWAYAHLERAQDRMLLRAGAGLPEGAMRLSLERIGTGGAGSATFSLDVHASDLAATLAAFGVTAEHRQPFAGPLNATLHAEGPANAVALRPLKVVLGPMSVSGTGQLDLSGAQPSLTATLRGNTLDFDALKGLVPRRSVSDDVPGPWSQKPLDLSWLGAMDFHLGLDLDGLTLGHLPFRAVSFTAGAKDGILNIDSVKAVLYGGPVTANLALRGGTVLPGFGASVKFAQVDGAALTKTLWARSFFTGPLTGAATLTAQGEGTSALAAASSGTLSLKSAAGTIQGLDAQNAEAVIAFTDLAVEAGLQGGALTVTSGQMKTAEGSAGVTGGLTLPGYTVNLTLARENKPGHVLITGPLDKPVRQTQ
jgi:uncharacterized protein involved in outer membrane biogenesis